MFYQIIKTIVAVFLKIFYPFQVIGHHHIPTNSRAIICCNHISNLDPPLLGVAMKRKIHYMAKAELFQVPILGKIISRLGAYPVNRGHGDTRAIKRSLQILRDEEILGIFPEGTRSRNGELGKAHIGAALIASKAKAPIVPAAIIGKYRLFRKMKVVFGEPFEVTQFQNESGKVDQNGVQAATDHMMSEIQKLLDQYR